MAKVLSTAVIPAVVGACSLLTSSPASAAAIPRPRVGAAVSATAAALGILARLLLISLSSSAKVRAVPFSRVAGKATSKIKSSVGVANVAA